MIGRTILIADDEAYLTHIVSYSIQKTGARVLVARNGSEVCTMAREHRPDLIVTDYQMPLMNGLDACVHLKREPVTAGIPVLLLTARGHRIAPSELAKTSVRALLAKPFSARELVAKIEELLAETPAAPALPHTTPSPEPGAAA